MASSDYDWMGEAIAEARNACESGDVPVGAVVVHRGDIIGRGHNRIEKTGFPFEHAEVVAMWHAVEQAGRHALHDSVVYVTIEPCVMCVGAMMLARVPRVVFGAREPKTGACVSVMAIPNEPGFDHRPVVIGGVREDECRELMQEFFRRLRRE